MNYSLENAQIFNWSSVSGKLLPERLSHLEKYLIGTNILESGCGGGAYVDFLSSKGLEATGIDLHDIFLQIAKDENRKGTYLKGDITKIPFPDKTFDSTYCFDVLEHIDDIVGIQEMARVTKKRLILTVPQKDEIMQKYGLTFLTYRDPTHLRYYTEESLNLLCKTICPKEVKILPEGLLPIRSIIEELIIFKNHRMRSLFGANILGLIVNDITLEKSYKFILRKFLDKVSFKEINLGMVAIVDL
jgi:SAM-dependent methyltransferase